MWHSTDPRPHGASMFEPKPANSDRKPLYKALALAFGLSILPAGGIASSAFAAPIAFTVNFDLVKVTNEAGVFSATGVGPGPFETQNGVGPVDFAVSDFGQIVSNYLSPRYFGSDAAPKGSLLLNLTNFKWNGSGFVPVTGVTIGGFVVEVARPMTDSILSADGGLAFPHFSISSDAKAVTFSGGDIPNAPPPKPGQTEELVWSSITPKAPQPPSSNVYLTNPTIPPDPNGEFANIRLVGEAVAMPEAPAVLIFLPGLLCLLFVRAGRSRRPEIK